MILPLGQLVFSSLGGHETSNSCRQRRGQICFKSNQVEVEIETGANKRALAQAEYNRTTLAAKELELILLLLLDECQHETRQMAWQATRLAATKSKHKSRCERTFFLSSLNDATIDLDGCKRALGAQN